MRFPRLIEGLKWLAVVAFGGMALILAGAVYAQFADWDIQGRLTQTLKITRTTADSPVPPVRVRLVLHRLLPDENALEVSAVLTIPSETAKSFRESGVSYLQAEIRDGYAIQEYALAADVKGDTNTVERGFYAESFETQRFALPFYPSIEGFPFDQVLIRPGVEVFDSKHTLLDTPYPQIEVQKAIPGRIMEAKDDKGFVLISLSRGPMEKMFVLLSAGVFILLSLVIGLQMFMGACASGAVKEYLPSPGSLSLQPDSGNSLEYRRRRE